MYQPAIAHLQLIAAGVRGVQQTQAHPAARHFDIRTLYAVYQQRIADTFYALKLIPKAIQVREAVIVPQP